MVYLYLSWYRPKIIIIVPNRYRKGILEKFLKILYKDSTKLPVLIETPREIFNRTNSNQINTDRVEKVFLEDISDYESFDDVIALLDLIHKNVQNLDGIGIHNLSLIAESTTDCPLLREIIGKYYDSSGLFSTDDLVETISLCDVKVVPFLCEDQKDHKNKMEKIISFSQKIGKNELILIGIGSKIMILPKDKAP